MKELGLNKPKWSDAEDDTNQLDGDEELEKYIAAKGLPHWNRHKYNAEKATPKYQEIDEPRDNLTDNGERLARDNGGKSQLPCRDSDIATYDRSGGNL